MSVTVSQPQNIKTVEGNGLALYKDATTNKFMVKDAHGQCEEVSTGSQNSTSILQTQIEDLYEFENIGTYGFYKLSMNDDTTLAVPQITNGATYRFDVELSGNHTPLFENTILLNPSVEYNPQTTNLLSYVCYKDSDGNQINTVFIKNGLLVQVETGTIVATGEVVETNLEVSWNLIDMPTTVVYYEVMTSYDNFATLDNVYQLDNDRIFLEIPLQVGQTLSAKVKATDSRGNTQFSNTVTGIIAEVTRSDNATIYYSVSDAIHSVESDYPNGLTQDVTIRVNSPITYNRADQTNNPNFYADIEDWNTNTIFSLVIDGADNLTIDCGSGGGFHIVNSSNIIFKDINFENVANYIDKGTPEQLASVRAEGSVENPIKNISITGCKINGQHPTDTRPIESQGRFALIFRNVENPSVIDTEIQRIATDVIEVSSCNVFYCSNLYFHNSIVNHYIVSQPSVIKIEGTDNMVMEDCNFDMTDTETSIISENLYRLFVRRCSFDNAKGELFRIENTLDMETVEIESCYIGKQLRKAHYSYINQYISIDNIKNFNLYNNRVVFSNAFYSDGVSPNSFTRFVSGYNFENIRCYNNVFEYRNDNESEGNSRTTTLWRIREQVQNWDSDNNVYQDILVDNNGVTEITNDLITMEDTTSPVYINRAESLLDLQSIGLDANSTFQGLSATLFLEDGSPTDYLVNLSASSLYVPKYDFNKQLISQPNIGHIQIITLPTTNDEVFEFLGINTINEARFDESSQYIFNSNSNLLMIPINNRLITNYKWEIISEDLDAYVYFGGAIVLTLPSRLDANGNYIGDLQYTINLINNTL